ncbi:MAG: DEAD/DEAH box helicase [Gemmatimonadales bacterium]
MERLRVDGFTLVPPERARDAIARFILQKGSDGSSDVASSAELGRIRLEQHQLSAATQLRMALHEFGGAFLCDPVGTGKTYAALALARPEERVLVVAPAVLREMWSQASQEAGRAAGFLSFEALSRGACRHGDIDLLIVDEAHHARNRNTIRFDGLSRAAAGARVVLLSATPIHNRRRDLTTLLSVFLGERAGSLTRAELGRVVVRRESDSAVQRIVPRTEPLRWCRMREEDSIPRMLLSLPPPLPPREGGDGGALIIHSMVRQWASSDAALAGALRRRLRRAIGLIAALEDGTYPSQQELAAWSGAEDAVQLAFSSLLAPPTVEAAELLPIVRAHRDAIVIIQDLLKSGSARDAERAEIVRRLRGLHRDRKVVAFSQYADTVEAMFGKLSADGEVALLSGTGARIAGGTITRREVIARFAPRASGNREPRRAESISMLLATDLLSEGVNLQDAGVVIHLDLPWTPARMEQRLGRVARMGSAHESVFAYAIRPPASADAIIGIEDILDRKMQEASQVTARFPSLLSLGHGSVATERSEAQTVEAVHELLATWLTRDSHFMTKASVWTAVSSKLSGFLAVCVLRGRTTLVGCIDGRASDDPTTVLQCMRKCTGPSRDADEAVLRGALSALESYLEATRALDVARTPPTGAVTPKRTALKRIALAAGRSRPHERALISALADRARNTVLGTFGAYAEMELQHLCGLDLPDGDLLERFANFPWGKSSSADGSDPVIEAWQAVAIVVFGPSQGNALSPATES